MIYEGIPCSNGIAIGKAFIYGKSHPVTKRRHIKAYKVSKEIEKLRESILLAKSQLTGTRSEALCIMGEDAAGIFDVHIAILNDPVLIKELEDTISSEKINAATAVVEIFSRLEDIYLRMEDEFFKERIDDIRDVGKRLLDNIEGIKPIDFGSFNERYIIVADELNPSDIAILTGRHILGIVAGKGGRTSHAAIMARTLHIPAVFGLGEAIRRIDDNEGIIIDGSNGKIIINPDSYQIEEYKRMWDRYNMFIAQSDSLSNLPAVTKDGRCVKLYANLDASEKIMDIGKYGAEGVGLYRSEFLYSACEMLPDEEKQFKIYKSAVEKLHGRPLTIRTLDTGDDKRIPCLKIPEETNPSLGFRSIRISLERPDMFKTQLRAILRAGAYGNILLMYPMVCCVSEIKEANRILEEAKRELSDEGLKFDCKIKKGIVVETPSAAIMIDVIIKEVDFISIGTNDLCQFIFAADRANPRVSYLYQAMHPAVLKLVGSVIDAAHRNGVPAAMCGEMASDPAAAFILLGLGLDEFSMNASSIPGIKKVIRSVSLQQAKEAAEYTLRLSTAAEVLEYSSKALRDMGL